MKNILLILVFSLVYFCAPAQSSKLSSSDLKALRKKEDSLKMHMRNTFFDSSTAGRMRSDSFFIKTLVRGLLVKNSFYYPFDSLKAVSKLYSPDSSFRIFTWHLDFDGMYVRQRGAIQYNTPDGKLKLVPLRDYSEFAESVMDSVRTKDTWIGAVYYNMIKTTHNGKDYYTLFGFDENSIRSNKKWIEVMTFNERGLPEFGGPFFAFQNDSLKRRPMYRYSFEYKKDASTTMNYDPELQMIVFDHLISESDEPDNPWTYIPDGDYEGFKWTNGRWVHVNKVYDQVIDMKGVDPYLGKPPVGDALLDKDGKVDEKKLQEKSDKNTQKKKDF